MPEPPLPDDLDLRPLPRSVRAELRGLSEDAAAYVGGHLLLAGRLIEDDPQAAYAHAAAARQRAPRLPVVREAVAETAYAAEQYQEALNEFRTIRRMSGDDAYLPAMADCERALGHLQEALKLIKQALPAAQEIDQVVELCLVEAGVRAELGQKDEALRLLRTQIERVGQRGPKLARARLRYAYADHLEDAGDLDGAQQWFAAAATLDADGVTDAAERIDAILGVAIEFDLDDEDAVLADDAVDDQAAVLADDAVDDQAAVLADDAVDDQADDPADPAEEPLR